MQPRQARHLRPALNLEHAHGIGLLQRAVNHGIVGRQLGQIDVFLICSRMSVDGLFQHRHHAQPEQIDLDDAHVGAIFFVPLHHHPAGHGGRLQRHDRIQLSLANHHSARVLAEMTRQVLHAPGTARRTCDARMAADRTRHRETAVPACRPGSLYSHELTSPARRSSVSPSKPSDLPNLARRRPSAIGDDVCGHRRAQLAVTLIHILNRALALVAAGQIEIDVRPLAALLREEALEQQLHAARDQRR